MKFLAPTLNKLSDIFDAQLLQYFLIICDNVSGKITKRTNEIDFIMEKTNNYYIRHKFSDPVLSNDCRWRLENVHSETQGKLKVGV